MTATYDRAAPALIVEKLLAFDRLEPEFEACFRYMQEMHGERRFPSCDVTDTVRYLHALWVCERKDLLLSVPKTIERYEGRLCLELLRGWQETGEIGNAVDFLRRKLDTLDVALLTRQLESERTRDPQGPTARRLAHGRIVLLNRCLNLLHALDPLFSLSESALSDQARDACKQFGHTPERIAEQLRELESPLYRYVRHPALARRNMFLMDRLGVRLMAAMSDRPGERAWLVSTPATPSRPYAEQVIDGYVALTAPQHNNPRDVRWVDRPEFASAHSSVVHSGAAPEIQFQG